MATDFINYRIDPGTPSVGVGSTAYLQLLGQAADGTWTETTAEYWYSSDDSVVAVDPGTGALTGVTAGQATVTAMIDSQTNTATFAEVAAVPSE